MTAFTTPPSPNHFSKGTRVAAFPKRYTKGYDRVKFNCLFSSRSGFFRTTGLEFSSPRFCKNRIFRTEKEETNYRRNYPNYRFRTRNSGLVDRSLTQITELLTKITVFAGRSVREANKALIFAEDRTRPRKTVNKLPFSSRLSISLQKRRCGSDKLERPTLEAYAEGTGELCYARRRKTER